MGRRHLKKRLKKPPSGLTLINLQKRKNMKKSRKSLRELHYQFYKRWEAVLLQQLTLQVVQPLKKSIKLFVTNFDFNRLYLNCECHLMVARNFLNYFKFNN